MHENGFPMYRVQHRVEPHGMVLPNTGFSARSGAVEMNLLPPDTAVRLPAHLPPPTPRPPDYRAAQQRCWRRVRRSWFGDAVTSGRGQLWFVDPKNPFSKNARTSAFTPFHLR